MSVAWSSPMQVARQSCSDGGVVTVLISFDPLTDLVTGVSATNTSALTATATGTGPLSRAATFAIPPSGLNLTQADITLAMGGPVTWQQVAVTLSAG